MLNKISLLKLLHHKVTFVKLNKLLKCVVYFIKNATVIICFVVVKTHKIYLPMILYNQRTG